MATIEAEPLTELLVDEKKTSPELEKGHESVLAVLLERQSNGYRRGLDNDGRKVGIAFDFGSYGGVISLAMARKLQIAGLLDFVDGFYGLSSGGVNAAFAATGQVKEGMDTYLNLMPDKGLIKPGELSSGKMPRMDLGVLREAITQDHPLDFDKLTEKGAPVVVIGAADIDDPYHRNKLFRSSDIDPEHPEEFIEQLILGCNYPILAGGPIEGKDGHRYTDAGMAWESAMELAAADHCTHILSLANSPPLKKAHERQMPAKLLNLLVAKTGQHYVDSQGVKRPPTFSLKEKVFNPVGSFLEDFYLTFSGDGSDYSSHDYKTIVKARDAEPYIFSESFYRYHGAQVERIYPPALEGLPGLMTPEKKQLRLGIKAGRLAVRQPLRNARE